MKYTVNLKPRAQKDIKSLPQEVQVRILEALERLQDHLSGDVKKLANFTPEYRLRVGRYRVLFEVEGTVAVVYRVLHRSKAYKQ